MYYMHTFMHKWMHVSLHTDAYCGTHIDIYIHVLYRYAYTLVFPSAWVNQYTSGKLTIGVLPISYICQTMSTWTVVAVALDR